MDGTKVWLGGSPRAEQCAASTIPCDRVLTFPQKESRHADRKRERQRHGSRDHQTVLQRAANRPVAVVMSMSAISNPSSP